MLEYVSSEPIYHIRNTEIEIHVLNNVHIKVYKTIMKHSVLIKEKKHGFIFNLVDFCIIIVSSE